MICKRQFSSSQFSRSTRKIPIRCNKAQMGLILRNCKPKKTQLLATNLAKAITVHPKLFHVEQFALLLLARLDFEGSSGISISDFPAELLRVEHLRP